MSKNLNLNFPGVYTITCTANGRTYVGQAVNIRKRWSFHRWQLNKGTHDNSHLQRSWVKYGADAFVFAVSANLGHLSGQPLIDALNHAELWTLQSFPQAFNMVEGGAGGFRVSDETRAARSADQKAKWANPEFRARITAAMRKKAADPEFQKRRGAAISIGKSTPKNTAKMSAQMKALWADPAHRAEQGAKRTSNWKDPEYRAKQSVSRAATWADPEVRARRSAAIRAGHARRRAQREA